MKAYEERNTKRRRRIAQLEREIAAGPSGRHIVSSPGQRLERPETCIHCGGHIHIGRPHCYVWTFGHPKVRWHLGCKGPP